MSTTTPTGEASVQELTDQEFIYHSDQVDPNGDDAGEREELSRGQIIMDVVKSLRSGKDLYRISLPAALLRPVSMLEYVTLFAQPHQFLVEYVCRKIFERHVVSNHHTFQLCNL